MPSAALKYYHLQPTWPAGEGPITHGQGNYLSYNGNRILNIINTGNGDIVITEG